jgi:hypothetical protein
LSTIKATSAWLRLISSGRFGHFGQTWRQRTQAGIMAEIFMLANLNTQSACV